MPRVAVKKSSKYRSFGTAIGNPNRLEGQFFAKQSCWGRKCELLLQIQSIFLWNCHIFEASEGPQVVYGCFRSWMREKCTLYLPIFHPGIQGWLRNQIFNLWILNFNEMHHQLPIRIFWSFLGSRDSLKIIDCKSHESRNSGLDSKH